MNENVESKLNRLMRQWANGNTKTAAQLLRNTTKVQLAVLLTQQHRLADGVFFDREQMFAFEGWVLRTLERPDGQ